VKEPKLPAKAEAWLKDWPLAEPEWEAFATRIVERAKAEPARDADDVSGAPLPAEPGEDGYQLKTPIKAEVTPIKAEVTPIKAEGTPVKAGGVKAPLSLADLARASVKKKNEGAKDIALESLQVASRERASVEEVAERVQAAKPPEKRPPRDLADRVPPSSAWVEEHQGAPSLPPRVTEGPRPSRGPWIVSGFAAIAAAAALILALKKSEPAPVATVNPAPVATTPAAGEAKPTSAPLEPEAAPLPKAEAPARAPEGPAPPEAPRTAEVQSGTPKRGATAPSAAPSGVKPEAVVLEEEESAPAPAPAAPTPPAASEKLRPAELPAGGLPDKPSSGAVNAALGSVMGAARACVAGQEGSSTARVVFGSDGSVQSVGVSGQAAGTPAAACIEGAFKRARVQPFASPSFSISTTIRPN
jgi:hypothetical protein